MGFTTYIYKLRCKDTNVKDSFIGHTTNPNTCKNYHKRRCNFSNGKLYQVMRDNGGWDNWKLNVLEKFEYSYNQQLKDKMEQEKLFHQPTLNAVGSNKDKVTQKSTRSPVRLILHIKSSVDRS